MGMKIAQIVQTKMVNGLCVEFVLHSLSCATLFCSVLHERHFQDTPEMCRGGNTSVVLNVHILLHPPFCTINMS